MMKHRLHKIAILAAILVIFVAACGPQETETPEPTDTPEAAAVEPTETEEPTEAPTETEEPTVEPTVEPTEAPTETEEPTEEADAQAVEETEEVDMDDMAEETEEADMDDMDDDDMAEETEEADMDDMDDDDMAEATEEADMDDMDDDDMAEATEEADMDDMDDDDMAEETEEADMDDMDDDRLPTIVGVALNTENLSTLTTAIVRGGFLSTFNRDGSFTVFAPTDDAFADALEALELTAEELLDNDELLNSVLTYHVIEGVALAADLEDGQEIETLNGAILTVEVSDDGVTLTDGTDATYNVIAADVMASNGVIHVIDGVLMPPVEED